MVSDWCLFLSDAVLVCTARYYSWVIKFFLSMSLLVIKIRPLLIVSCSLLILGVLYTGAMGKA